jgi:hypothetical protein
VGVTIEVKAPSKVLALEGNEPLDVYRALLGRTKGNRVFMEPEAIALRRNRTPSEAWDAFLRAMILNAGYAGAMDRSRDDNTIIFDPRRIRPIGMVDG